ncbi:MAG: hydrogenase iron-sulfur subunit [Candidatus Helarchaeota archaeon]
MEKDINKFTPKIVAFLCNWSNYTGNDFLELHNSQVIPSLKIIRLMCSGRLHPALILDAFKNGSDGVLIYGCSIGNCHYISGNVKAEERVNEVKKLLDILNINPDRLRLELVSPNKDIKLSDIIKDFTDNLIVLGPFKIEI